MTALSDQCETIRGWLNLGSDVYPDSVVTSWIRMAEETLSKRLRCKDMVKIVTGTLIESRYLLPPDWRESDFTRVVGGSPLRYTPRDDFYNPEEPFKSDQKNCYTLIGNYIAVASILPNGTVIELAYFQDVPPLDSATWLSVKYPTLFLMAALTMAAMYAIEDTRKPLWEGETTKLIDEINEEYMRSKASGSRLTTRHRRSFG